MFEFGIPREKIRQQIVRTLPRAHALLKSKSRAARRVRNVLAMLADDVGIRKRRQEAQIDRERCPARVGRLQQSARQQRLAHRENVFKPGGVLPADAVALCGGSHGLLQSDRWG